MIIHITLQTAASALRQSTETELYLKRYSVEALIVKFSAQLRTLKLSDSFL